MNAPTHAAYSQTLGINSGNASIPGGNSEAVDSNWPWRS